MLDAGLWMLDPGLWTFLLTGEPKLNCSEEALQSHLFSNISKEYTFKKEFFFGEITGWQSGAAILYYSDTTKNVFLGIFQKFLEHLDIIVCRGK